MGLVFDSIFVTKQVAQVCSKMGSKADCPSSLQFPYFVNEESLLSFLDLGVFGTVVPD